MSADCAVAIVLAAGAGSRFHDSRHKLLVEVPATTDRPRESLSARAVATALAAAIGDVVIVTGRLDGHELGLDATLRRAEGPFDDRMRPGGPPPRVRTVHNRDWADGQMTSVRTGLGVARDLGATIVVVGLADQPGITPDAWRAVSTAATDGAAIAVATYGGRRGNPVALRDEVWALMADAGDEGARSLMRVRPDLVVEVPCTGSPTDIDTVEDLRRWQNNSSTNSP